MLLAGFIGSKDLEVRCDYRGIAVEGNVRQPGEMGEPAGDRCLMTFAFEACRNRLVAGRAGQAGTAIEYPVLGINGFGIGGSAGVGAGRVAGDEIIDGEPILDGAEALLKARRICSLGHEPIP